MINKLFKNRYFLTGLQFFTLIVFVLIIYGGIGVTTNDPDFAKILRNTNLPNLIVWSYWWPLIIVTAILFGRYWCSICPMELITSFFGKIGLRNKPGDFLKSGWVITLFYAIILILGIHTFAIHRIPQFMAIYMLALFAVAVITGLIWEKRTFCTYVCPIGHLLGLYSLLSFNKLRVKDSKICKTCKTKDCIHSSSHYKFVGRSCTSELYPPNITDNRSCILCGQCFKSCSKDNIAIQKRKFAADLFTTINLKWAEIAFFMIVSGFVVYEILSEWSVSKKIVMAIPTWLNQSLNITGSATGTIKALILFVVLPFVFYFILALAKKQLAKESWKSGFSQIVLAILPITASVHLLKALLKTTSRIPYWKFVFFDPKGVETATEIIQNNKLLQNDFLTNIISPTIGFIAVLLPISGLILSFYVIKKQIHTNRISKTISVLSVIIYSGVFIIVIFAWKWL
jgi:polyferredoxin